MKVLCVYDSNGKFKASRIDIDLFGYVPNFILKKEKQKSRENIIDMMRDLYRGSIAGKIDIIDQFIDHSKNKDKNRTDFYIQLRRETSHVLEKVESLFQEFIHQ